MHDSTEIHKVHTTHRVSHTYSSQSHTLDFRKLVEVRSVGRRSDRIEVDELSNEFS